MARPRKGITFWDRVAAGTVAAGPDNCWHWTGHADECGYPRIHRDGHLVRLHRAVWERENGAIPDGMCVCHSCDNPGCLNPRHLWLGTHQDNMDDCRRKGRKRGAPGTRNPSAKLTEEAVAKIRRRIAAGESCASIGRAFGVADVTIIGIKNGRLWRHVEGIA